MTLCVYICVRVSFHQERGHDVTRFVAPQCNLDRAGWDQSWGVRGERSYGIWKYHRAQRTDVRVIEERMVIEQAIIFIASSCTRCLLLQMVGWKRPKWSQDSGRLWHVYIEIKTLFLSQITVVPHFCLCRGLEIWCWWMMDSPRFGTQLSNSHYHNVYCWLQASFGQMEAHRRSSDVWGKSCIRMVNG